MKTESWRQEAACLGVTNKTIFFPEVGGKASDNAAEARLVCKRCPVKTECLDFALVSNEKFGVWGGTTPQERRKLRRGRVVHSLLGAAQ